MTLSRDDTRAAFEPYLAVKNRKAWPELADLFTEDASYEDPFFGRIEGRDPIRAFLVKSMTGLEDWEFPVQWTAYEEGLVVMQWFNRLPGERRGGGFFEFPGISTITFRDDGMITSQTDLYDRLRALKVIGEGKSPVIERMVRGLELASSPLVMGLHRLVGS